tara:strand:- start:30 stop:170 length:141 start_codon:yes stop_codon:yes gene_type:complete
MFNEEFLSLIERLGIAGFLLFIWHTELRSIKKILQELLDKYNHNHS